MSLQHLCKSCGQSFTRYNSANTLCQVCSYNKYAKPNKPLKRIGKVTKRWQEVRKQYLSTQPKPYRCSLCNTLTPTPDVDHIKKRGSHPDLRFDLSNLRIVCRDCHIKVT